MLTDRHVIEMVRRANPAPDLEHLEPRHEARVLLAVADKERAMETLTPTPRVTPPPSTPQRWRRPVTAFAAALIVTLVAVGVVALMSGNEPDVAGVTTTEAAPTTTQALPITTAGPGEEAPPQETTNTTKAPEAPTLFDGTWTGHERTFWAAGLQETSFGLVANGSRQVLISQNGIDWAVSLETPFEPLDPQPTDLLPGEPPLGYIESNIKAVLEHDSMLYAFGSVSTDMHSGNGRVDQYMWSTTDGVEWTQYPFPGVGQDYYLRSAVSLGDALVVSFTDDRQVEGTFVFRSEDGIGFDRVEVADSGLAGVSLNDLAVFDGRAIAVGIDSTADIATFPWGKRSIFVSETGERWEPLAGSDFAPNELPDHTLVVDGETIYLGGVVVVEEGDVAPPALWRSTDGRTFEPVELDPEALRSWGFVADVVPTDRGVLVVVWLAADETRASKIVLLAGATTDDLTLVPDRGLRFEGAGVDAGNAAAHGDRIVILGSIGMQPDVRTYTWIWTPEA
jgi:hypothetical protein